MALKGTLKDFGIADILQLIGQQQKTGTLHLKSKDQEVHIGFKDGNIVKAESASRSNKDLIGGMLVRAELITEQQLEVALETQRRTLNRLGDALVQAGALSAERFREMVQLQTTETLYRLFSWKTGSYEFELAEVDYDPNAMAPLRAESVLMEGFRRVDEWPVIKRKIASYQMTFARGKDLDGAADEGSTLGGESERRVYGLAIEGRDVRRLIDLSCLGEFETCKALCNLVNQEHLLALPVAGKVEALAAEGSRLGRAVGAVGRVLITAAVLGVLAWVATRLDLDSVRFSRSSASGYADPAAQRFISRQQLARIQAALDVYRLEKGEVPEQLNALVEAGLLAGEDLRYPWQDDYYYRRTDPKGFILLPPLR